MSIIRTFDINKPGTNIYDVCGGIIGGTIKQGQVKIGDRVKILPGIIHNNKQKYILAKLSYDPHSFIICNGSTPLLIIYSAHAVDSCITKLFLLRIGGL